MKVIVSIHPQPAERIFTGEKKFEFRKNIFKSEVRTVIVYVTMPVGKVVGEFEIDEIIHENVETLWELTGSEAGITKEYYDAYYNGKSDGFAIKIKSVCKYAKALDINECFGVIAPQQFVYIQE